MSTQTLSKYDFVHQLPADAEVRLYNVSWEEYEDLLEEVGEASGLRISYDHGTLEIMTLSAEHENYVRFVEKLTAILSLRLHLNLRSFGSATMKRRRKSAGKEPDACFYIQSVDLIGNRMQLDFAVDPPPDVVVEIDLHHDSRDRFPIYAALGVSEIWRFDGQALTIFHLQQDSYLEQEASLALPFLTSRILSEYLNRLRDEGEFQSLLAFDEWLQSVSR
jgi:Uma2 family endonuclease